MDFNNLDVISVNNTLMYFKCKKYGTILIINAGFSRTYCGVNLPQVGTKFDLEKIPHHSSGIHLNDEFYLTLCHKNYSQTSTTLQPGQNAPKLSRLIRGFKLGCSDLVVITKMYEDNKDKAPPELDLAQFVLSYVEKILTEKALKVATPDCYNNVIPRITCVTISRCKQILVEKGNYKDFPYWSFGTRWGLQEEVLIGEFYVHPKFGTICFRDKDSTVGCVVPKRFLEDFDVILNKPVYIENFCIFSEIFNPNDKFNLEYLYVKYEDIKVLGNKRKRNPNDTDLKLKLSFLLVSKSNVTYTPDKGFHFWLDITEPKHHNEDLPRFFLCLPERFIVQHPEVEPSRYYTLKFSRPLALIRDSEYTRVNPNLRQFMLQRDNYAKLSFNEDYYSPPSFDFLNPQSLPRILARSGLVNFQAVLKFRKFTESNSSRTLMRNVPPIFGTIGEKTHILDFQVDRVKTLTVYLNNWERMVTPIGLIPGVLVNVRNVKIQGTYCKSTALTSFEIVRYEPQFKFQTARLLTEEDWGLKYFLGGPNTIPNGALIYTVISTYKIVKIFLKRSCELCGYISRIKGKTCVECRGEMVTSCDVLVGVSDERGTAKITIKDLEMARCFLGVKESRWNDFLDALEEIGQYNFIRYDRYVNYALSAEKVKLINKLNSVVKQEEDNNKKKIHMLCRKLDNSRNRRRGETLWYGVRARICYD